MQHKRQWPVLFLGALLLAPQSGVFAQTDSGANQRRLAVLQAAGKGVAGLPVLKSALNDKNLVVRRTAARSLANLGAPARDTLVAVLKDNSDPLVRRTALRALLHSRDASTMKLLAVALKDPSDMVRIEMVQALVAQRPLTPETTALLKQAQQDPSDRVSNIAGNALWPFHKETHSARERPDLKDAQLSIATTIPLPLEGWRFKLDPRQEGHLQNWFASDFDDSSWNTIAIGNVWEESGYKYDGVAWYRRTFTLPDKPASVGVDLFFEGVDESAWVWINGEYAGQHDIGPAGWNQPFHMEVTGLLKWGAPNQITVRVLDRAMGGGIWKPVSLEVLKR